MFKSIKQPTEKAYFYASLLPPAIFYALFKFRYYSRVNFIFIKVASKCCRNIAIM